MSIRVLIAQEQGVVRSALRALLEAREDLEVAGEIAHPDGFVPALRETEADALILDCGMHRRLDGAVLQDALAMRPALAVVVLGMCEEESCVERFLVGGVRGYVLKTSPESELLRAIYTACRGEFYLDSSLSGGKTRSRCCGSSRSHKTLPGVLTRREQEVCRLLAYGYTNAEVAEKLEVSERTVEAHRARIMSKLKLRNRADLVRFALYSGLLRVTD